MEAFILCAVVGLPIAAIAIAAFFGSRRANAQFEATQRAIEGSSTSADAAGPITLVPPHRVTSWVGIATPALRQSSVPGTLADGLPTSGAERPYHALPATDEHTAESRGPASVA